MKLGPTSSTPSKSSSAVANSSRRETTQRACARESSVRPLSVSRRSGTCVRLKSSGASSEPKAL